MKWLLLLLLLICIIPTVYANVGLVYFNDTAEGGGNATAKWTVGRRGFNADCSYVINQSYSGNHSIWCPTFGVLVANLSNISYPVTLETYYFFGGNQPGGTNEFSFGNLPMSSGFGASIGERPGTSTTKYVYSVNGVTTASTIDLAASWKKLTINASSASNASYYIDNVLIKGDAAPTMALRLLSVGQYSTAQNIYFDDIMVYNWTPEAVVAPVINITSGYTDGQTFTTADSIIANFTATGVTYPVKDINYTFNGSAFNVGANLTLWLGFNNDSDIGDSTTLANDFNDRYNGTIAGDITGCDTCGRYRSAMIYQPTDTTGHFVNVTNPSALARQATNLPFTVAIWNYIPSGSQIIVDSNRGYLMANGNNVTNFFFRYFLGSGVIYLTATIGNSATGNVGDNVTNSLNTWHLSVITYDGTNAREYQDTKLLKTWLVNFTGFTTTNSYIMIGQSSTQSRAYSGYIDDVMIWANRTLTVDEITYLYNHSLILDKQNRTQFMISTNQTPLSGGTYNYSLGVYDANNITAILNRYLIINSTSNQCIYSGSGNWLIGNTSCNITIATNLLKNNITIKNATVRVNVSIINYTIKTNLNYTYTRIA